MNKTLAERLKTIRELAGNDQKTMAEQLNISFRSWQDYELGKSVPGGKVFEALVKLGFNANWLLTGDGEMRGGTSYAMPEILKNADNVSDLGEGFVHVPRYKVSASAGGGALIHSEQIVDHLAFRADWVKMALGVPVSSLALINVTGDSMEPTLSNGDLILIDTTIGSVDDSGVYVLRFDGKLKVKRLHSKADSVDILSDNPRYPTETLRGDLLQGLNVVGRVVWCGRRM